MLKEFKSWFLEPLKPLINWINASEKYLHLNVQVIQIPHHAIPLGKLFHNLCEMHDLSFLFISIYELKAYFLFDKT